MFPSNACDGHSNVRHLLKLPGILVYGIMTTTLFLGLGTILDILSKSSIVVSASHTFVSYLQLLSLYADYLHASELKCRPQSPAEDVGIPIYLCFKVIKSRWLDLKRYDSQLMDMGTAYKNDFPKLHHYAFSSPAFAISYFFGFEWLVTNDDAIIVNYAQSLATS